MTEQPPKVDPVLLSERGVLGSMLIDRDAQVKAFDALSSADFFQEAHRIVFATMEGMSERDESVDLVTLSDRLTHDGNLERIGGSAYLTGLGSRLATGAHVERFCREVRQASKTRKQRDQLQRALALTQEADYDPDAGAGALVTALTEDTDMREIVPISTAVLEAVNEADRDVHYLRTGTDRLNYGLAWLKENGVLQILAKAGTGKTALGIQVTLQEVLAGSYGLMFSAEMAREDIGERVIGWLAGLDMRRGTTRWSDDEADRFGWAVSRLDEASHRWLIDDTDSIPIDLLVARARRVDMQFRAEQRRRGEPERGIDIILVDYLQTLKRARSKRDREETMERQVTEASEALKGLAKRLRCRMLVITSLSNEGRTRHSGEVDYHVDGRLVLERPDPDGDLVEAKLLKARRGRMASFRLRFDGLTYRYTDWDAPPESAPPPERRQPSRSREREPGDDRVPF